MNSGSNATTSRELLKMTTDDYLERTQATLLLEEAITHLVENRPEEPLVFLTKHFKMLSGDFSAVETSAHYVLASTRLSNPAFDDNMVLAYQALLGKDHEHVSMSNFQRVLELVNQELPSAHASRLNTHLINTSALPKTPGVGYVKFKEAMELCIYYDALLAQAEDLFLSIDTGSTGEVKCSALLGAIEAAQATRKTSVTILLKVRDSFDSTKDASAAVTLPAFLDRVQDIVFNA
ncbi:hypothetical protein SPRG_19765 [Saprolegnia parasitica CBS 223.65]|uniref:RIIa domain-containing protein n=1 Tax=Saprolegnia parasitica (strain CBS 223.65) TaxID=695850 RepID=A0A067CI96_SAPPC|nr:hypothetical protein SPRG_19765 [Saprolegnia parasitica CBS 223.65]KDO30203.1 hypothetical protein SPRG_19765 [Saprolegnia parasitica CBS 223.65]|eukprot:XP_012199020.1 hypothetical protein SPRG_19765 [Saprolegnia parasitica CBS 223.65]